MVNTDFRNEDMHFRNASRAFGIPIETITLAQRWFAKQCAFGAPDEEAALKNLEIAIALTAVAATKDIPR